MSKEIILSKGEICLVDDEYFEYLNKFIWYLDSKKKVVRRTSVKNTGKHIKMMHREILEISKNITDKNKIHHLNGRFQDNRKENLFVEIDKVNIGDIFGKLTVIGESEKRNKNNNRQFVVDCSCGSKNLHVEGYSLRKGHTQSCGCLHKEKISKKILDKRQSYVGKVFGERTVLEVKISLRKNGDPKGQALCQCSCGSKPHWVDLGALEYGVNLSCGCLQKKNHFKTHGLSKHPLYSTWFSMNTRCYNPEVKAYKEWGGRGIKVCPEWLSPKYGGNETYLGLINFIKWAEKQALDQNLRLEDIYSKTHDKKIRLNGKKYYSLDRIDNNGNYCPENCRWATSHQQIKNRRKVTVLQEDYNTLLRENAELKLRIKNLEDKL